MTISWRGLGYLGFMIPLALWGLASVIWGHNNWIAIRVALLIAAVAVWFLGKKLNAEDVDDEGKALHQAFGMPMQWFSVVVLALFLLSFT
jgi:hypothetical protein